MTVYEAFMMYNAIVRHFKTDQYDYFKYNGKLKPLVTAFEKLSEAERSWYVKLTKQNNPEVFVAGNMIFNPSKNKWISTFDDGYRDELLKYQQTGLYLFQQELKKLPSNIFPLFKLEEGNITPTLLTLLSRNAISLHTTAVLVEVFNLEEYWKKFPTFDFFAPTLKKVCKASGFFRIERDKYRAVIDQWLQQNAVTA